MMFSVCTLMLIISCTLLWVTRQKQSGGIRHRALFVEADVTKTHTASIDNAARYVDAAKLTSCCFFAFIPFMFASNMVPS